MKQGVREVRRNATCLPEVDGVGCVDTGWCDDAIMSKDPISFLGGLVREHGDCVRYQSALGRYVVFNHPQHVKKILHSTHLTRGTLLRFIFGDSLVTSQGSLWRQRRNLLQPFFLPKYVETFGDVISSVIDRTKKRWQASVAACEPVDIGQEMNRIALEVIFAALCSLSPSSQQINTLAVAISSLFDDLSEIQKASLGYPIAISPRRNRNVTEATNVIDEFIYEIIHRRRSETSPPCDLLSHIINTKDLDGRVLSDKNLRDELVTIILTGHETTAMSLSWMWYLLSLHPSSERRLHRELDEVLGNRSPKISDLPRLVWTEQVIKEAMRLYPPIWFIVRHAKEDIEVDGIKVSAGDFPIVCLSTLHRHPMFWDNPNKFDPDRFAGGLSRSQSGAFLPFGLGSHVCIGQHISMLEQMMALASLGSQFRVRPIDNRQIKPFAGVSLRMDSTFMANITGRHSDPATAVSGKVLPFRDCRIQQR